MGRNLTRWLIPLPAILFSFFPSTAQAEPPPGLNAVGYNFYGLTNYEAPTQSDTLYPVCHTEVENNINRNFNGEPFGTCPYDYFMVHYSGFITIPANNTIQFMIAADDGGIVTIGDTQFGDWNYKVCSWSTATTASFSAGSHSLDGWYYERNGFTCYMLAWNINNTGWVIVPDSAFTKQTVPTTTTTSSTTSTSTTTTTTSSPPTTTTSSTTTLPEETTTTTEPVQSSTTTSTTSTTTSTTTTVAPVPTTTQAPYTPPQTTTTTEPPVTTTSSTTTTTSLPEPSTTVEETSTTTEPLTTTTTELATTTTESATTTSTTVPVEPDPTVPESVPVQSSVAPTLPVETSTPSSQPPLETDTQETLPLEVESSSTTTLPGGGSAIFTEEQLDAFVEQLEIKANEPISDAKVEQILEVLADAAPAQIVAAIEQVLATDITSDQAVSIASSPEVLAAVTEEQAEAIFEEIVVEELTAEVAEELVAVLNEAPTKVKKAFQETIDVFSGLFDSFQMVGQTIPVGERRTLVAVSNTLVAVGASLRRKEAK